MAGTKSDFDFDDPAKPVCFMGSNLTGGQFKNREQVLNCDFYEEHRSEAGPTIKMKEFLKFN